MLNMTLSRNSLTFRVVLLTWWIHHCTWQTVSRVNELLVIVWCELSLLWAAWESAFCKRTGRDVTVVVFSLTPTSNFCLFKRSTGSVKELHSAVSFVFLRILRTLRNRNRIEQNKTEDNRIHKKNRFEQNRVESNRNE